ncbi:MAG: non-canonical purine NTP diphosphatase [Flavobacteriaceae bacterium]|nr:non-canonical purine NTP diphosphatase [Flavobacteriaceae bacterium]
MKIIFATHNQHKLSEVQKLLPKHINLLSLNDINCNEDIEETGKTLEENAHIKADYIYKNYHYSCFADDTGLEVKSLDNRPGVFSARYAGKENNSEKNMQKLLGELEGISDRKAQFRTVIALYLEGKKYEFEGICKGTIAYEKQGKKGFGYDPLFVPEGYEQSFAEMSQEEKNKISHRGKAIQKLVQFLEKL